MRKTIAAMVLAATAFLGFGVRPAEAYNNAPAEHICKYAQPGYPWITTRWTNFVFYGQYHVGCTYWHTRNRTYLCTFYNRHSGASAWVECPTP